ncbi:MAG: phosphoglucosamine mutase [Sphingobacteriales bacterium]|nr:phosphoglucosamine mutase [Sphingobacteriales bacterium]
MSLIKSISGIRGTIGGKPGDNLTPVDIVKFTAAYGKWLKEKQQGNKVVLGRDGRMSSSIVSQLAINTLLPMGIDVVDAGLSTTPTVEMAVVWEKADGGIILTASHNPKEWNALKLLNNKGEFISAEDGQYILEIAAKEDFLFNTVDTLGKYASNNTFIEQHINAILNYQWVDAKIIAEKNFTVVVDAINSTGAISVPQLLKKLGVKNIIVINENITGDFAHNPEPLAEHLTQLSKAVVDNKADLGIAIDPDVDRLCFVNETGELFGEEYTLVAIADYILSQKKGATVSNLSSTRALKDVSEKHGCDYYASAVGEVNVVKKMKELNAVIGGEGNGGIIVPDFHYGRDALIGIGLFLTALAQHGGSISAFKKQFPQYEMLKSKIELGNNSIDIKSLLGKMALEFIDYPLNREDGLKIDFPDGWVHLRSSNTEPIMRIYAEGGTKEIANALVSKIILLLGV